MTLTREPSGRRASQIGEASSTRRPIWLTMRWQMFSSCWLSRKRMPVLLDLAVDFDVDRAGAVDHDVGDVVARQQRLERAVAEHVVADVVEQLFLLGDRHHDVLDRDDLVDDVADFLARGIGVEACELREVDRLDQRAEDRALGLVIAFRAARIDRRHGDRGGRPRRRRRRDQRRAEPVGGERRAAALPPRPSAARRAAAPAQRQRHRPRVRRAPGRGLRRCVRFPNTILNSRQLFSQFVSLAASSAWRATA